MSTLKLGVDSQGGEQKLQSFDQSVRRVAEGISELGTRMRQGQGGFTSFVNTVREGAVQFAAVALVVREAWEKIKEFVNIAAEGERTVLRLSFTLRTLENAAGITVERVEELAQHFRSITNFDDDAIVAAAENLLRFGRVTQDSLEGALETAINLAAVLRTDVPEASRSLARVLVEPGQGLEMLRRAGVPLRRTEIQDVQNTAAGEGQLAAQRALMELINRRGVEGAAANEAQGLPGGVAAAGRAFEDLIKAIGRFTPIWAVLTLGLNAFALAIDTVSGAVNSLTGAFGAAAAWYRRQTGQETDRERNDRAAQQRQREIAQLDQEIAARETMLASLIELYNRTAFMGQQAERQGRPIPGLQSQLDNLDRQAVLAEQALAERRSARAQLTAPTPQPTGTTQQDLDALLDNLKLASDGTRLYSQDLEDAANRYRMINNLFRDGRLNADQFVTALTAVVQRLYSGLDPLQAAEFETQQQEARAGVRGRRRRTAQDINFDLQSIALGIPRNLVTPETIRQAISNPDLSPQQRDALLARSNTASALALRRYQAGNRLEDQTRFEGASEDFWRNAPQNVRITEQLAQAFDRGREAVREATIQQRLLEEQQRIGRDSSGRLEQQIRQETAAKEHLAIATERLTQAERGSDAVALARATLAGPGPAAQERLAAQVRSFARAQNIALDDPRLAGVRQAYGQAAAGEAAAGLAGRVSTRRDNIEELQTESRVVFANEQTRRRAIETLRLEQQVRRDLAAGIDPALIDQERDALSRFLDESDRLDRLREFASAGKEAFSQIGDAIDAVAFKGKNANEVIHNLLLSLASMAARRFLINPAFDWLGGQIGFGTSALGGVMSGQGPIRYYAGGGVARSPQLSVFGEGATPEAYLPIPGGKVPVQWVGAPGGGGGGGVVMNLSVNVTSDDIDDERRAMLLAKRLGEQLGRMIETRIDTRIAYQQRPGGSLGARLGSG